MNETAVSAAPTPEPEPEARTLEEIREALNLAPGEGLRLLMNYRTDLFDAATIERLLEQFETLLQGAVDNPDRPISELPLLTERQRQQVLVEWNDTELEYADMACVHQLFEAQVAQTPELAEKVPAARQLPGLGDRHCP